MENSSELPEEKRDNILRKIYERLSDRNVKNELNIAIKKIEEIYGYPIDITLIVKDSNESFGIDTYNEDSYDYMMDMNHEDMLKKPEETTMKLSEFIKYISEEDKNLKVGIDPIYLEKGVNEIGNVLLTTFNDKIIIVPKPTKEL